MANNSMGQLDNKVALVTEADEALNLRDMYATHTLFRREFALAPRLVRDVTEEDPPRTRLVCEHLDLIMTLLITHHQAQDTCDWPSPPDPGQPAVTRRTEAEHTTLHQLTDHITTLIHQWSASASNLHAKQLAAALEQLTLLINDRMARREETILWPRTASLAS
jgi:hypothetical protein